MNRDKKRCRGRKEIKKEFLDIYRALCSKCGKCFDKMEMVRNERKRGFETFLASNYSRGVTLRESENRVCNFQQKQDN